MPSKFLAPIRNSNGLYEIRIEYQSNIYRIFCCFDEDKIVVLLNGFQKKTLRIEIERAIRIKSEYFQTKI